MRALVVCTLLLSGCAEFTQSAPSSTCVIAGSTRVLAWDIDPDVPITGKVHDGVMTVVYESTRRGRTAIDLEPEDLTIIGVRRVDPEPVSGPNGFVRLMDERYPAVAFVAYKDMRSALAVAPFACVH